MPETSFTETRFSDPSTTIVRDRKPGRRTSTRTLPSFGTSSVTGVAPRSASPTNTCASSGSAANRTWIVGSGASMIFDSTGGTGSAALVAGGARFTWARLLEAWRNTPTTRLQATRIAVTPAYTPHLARGRRGVAGTGGAIGRWVNGRAGNCDADRTIISPSATGFSPRPTIWRSTDSSRIVA